MAIVYNTSVVRTGLQVWLDAANVKSYPGSGTTWTDLSGNGRTGTLSGGASYISSNNGGIFFDGTDDLVTVASTATFTSTLTVECWYRGTKAGRNHLWNINGASSSSSLYCDLNDTGYGIWMYWESGGGNAIRFSGSGTYTDNTFRHFVFVHNGSTNQVYMNNVLLTPTDTIGTQTFAGVGGTNITVGGDPAFGGTINTFRVYNIALTATQISQNFEALRGRYGV